MNLKEFGLNEQKEDKPDEKINTDKIALEFNFIVSSIFIKFFNQF